LLLREGRSEGGVSRPPFYETENRAFQQAIDKDSGYAVAYVGLADSYNWLGGGLHYFPPSQTLPKAKAAAMKALELG